MLETRLSLGLLEIIVFQLGAIILGFTIHFFWSARKALPSTKRQPEQNAINPNDEWQLKYYELADLQEKHESQLRKELKEAKDNEDILLIEIEELRKELKQKAEKLREVPAEVQPTEYLEQLKTAHNNLNEHNHHITRLLEQIEMLKESERKYAEVSKANEVLNTQLRETTQQLLDKEREIKHVLQHQSLSTEMKDRVDKVYEEFNALQLKLQKVESYINKPSNRSFEYDDLQDSYFKLTKEFDETKLKQLSMMEENQRLLRLLADTEDKLREANFQRQHLNKKVAFLEELNQDLQQLTGQNKKLENQLRRIGEIESLLARVSGGKKPGETN